MFGELLIPTARDSPPAPSSSCPVETARSVLLLLLPWRSFLRPPLLSSLLSSIHAVSSAHGTLSSGSSRISFSRIAQHVLIPPAHFSQDAFYTEDEQDRSQLNLRNCRNTLFATSRLESRNTSAGEFLDSRVKTRFISILSSRLHEN